ncbi:TPA: hypothetical protein DIC40_01490 [Patescibacteria group bacterium]|nr:hypothetical protein [Candidatus Gracilibacteria bacterium]
MGTKLDVSEIKKGSILEIDGDLFRTIDVSFMQCQQRQGSYTLKVKNLVTGGVQSKPFKS